MGLEMPCSNPGAVWTSAALNKPSSRAGPDRCSAAARGDLRGWGSGTGARDQRKGRLNRALQPGETSWPPVESVKGISPVCPHSSEPEPPPLRCQASSCPAWCWLWQVSYVAQAPGSGQAYLRSGEKRRQGSRIPFICG